LLVGGDGQVVFQVAVEFDGLNASMRDTLCELDMGGLLGEVRLPGGSFRRCKSLRSVVWPAGLCAVGDSCFEECGLGVVDWSVTRVRTAGKWVFSCCRSLSRIVWSRELEVVGRECCADGDWRGCPLEALDFTGTSLTEVGEGAFAHCERLTAVAFPITLMVLGDRASARCPLLSIVNMASTRVTRIGEGAFLGCRRLVDIALPSTLLELGSACFSDTAVRELDLSMTKCTSIGSAAFSRCKQLSEMPLPASVRCVGDHCFLRTGLRAVNLRETGIEEIGDFAFSECGALQELILPKALRAFGKWCVYGTPLGIIDLSATRVRHLHLWALHGMRAPGEVMLPATLERLDGGDRRFEMWGLDMYVDHLRIGVESLRSVVGLSRLCLRGAAWRARWVLSGEPLILSGSASGDRIRLARPLTPAA
jgi:hypothetical protein